MRKVTLFTCAIACLLTAALAVFCTALFLLPERKAGEYTPEDKLCEAMQVIRENFIGEMDEDALTDSAVDAMVYGLGDRWSYYITAEEMADYRNTVGNSYGGIGIVLGADETGLAVIRRVYSGSPAGEAGVEAGSRFLRVGETDVSGSDQNAVVELIRAAIEAGTVDLTLQTPAGETRSFSLVPGDVLTEPVSFTTLDSGLGYIRLENFEARSAQDAIAAIESLTAAGVPGIIFDVRENPGGQLDELLRLLDYILPAGDIFVSRDIDGTEHVDVSGESCVKLPMAVLIDEDTYSAAEFFAAALREYEWAVVVGAPSTGKGYAQITVSLSDGSAIHISHIAYYTPQRVSLAGVGLAPDIKAELSLEARRDLYYGLLAFGDDDQLRAAETALLASP